MHVIMLSWEYPPKIVGGIARHVYDLANTLVKQGVKVHVITCEHPGAPDEEIENGVSIHRVVPYGHSNDFIHWVQLLNDAMYVRGDALLEELTAKNAKLPVERREPIVLHPHDWLAHYSANGLKEKYKLPMVATVHATEFGRNNGIHTTGQRYINQVEWELQHSAWRVIVCTDFMRRECQYALQTPWEKMDVIYNGVIADKFSVAMTDREKWEFRSRYAAPEEKIIFFVGRMVREKGVQVLIEALPKIRWGYHDSKLLICGGGYRDHLVQLAQYLGMENHAYFAGFVPDDDLMKIYQIIDIACFPSLYEPFGIVALEGMAAHVPVVVSDAGGLPEVVENGVTGTTTYAGNSNSLGDGLLSVLYNPGHARWMADNGFDRVSTVFNWDIIAKQTTDVYKRVWSEYMATGWADPPATTKVTKAATTTKAAKATSTPRPTPALRATPP